MSRHALVLHDGAPGEREERLGRILTFFGVPWQWQSVPELRDAPAPSGEQAKAVVFGSIETLALGKAAVGGAAWLRQVDAVYGYGGGDRASSAAALEAIGPGRGWSLLAAPAGNVAVSVSADHRDVAGPMAGVRVTMALSPEDATFEAGEAAGGGEVASLVSAGGAPAFVRFEREGVPVFLCASARTIDIEAPVARNYYDIKDHFCSAVPLVMFLRWAFRDVMWQPRELGACLIIDDPLLKRQYGFCDFPRMRDLMKQHGFTTNVAFIPWNWRRTSAAGSRLFREEASLFSVSIHGCDHTAAEFGATSIETLDRQAKLAQTRMRGHQRRTRIDHDPVMVFPQGVFSSQCPGVLKRNGFVAAVNTEVSPVDGQNGRTAVQDVWDVATMRYGNFPIYTRRYESHGIENFAFDLLLGKPCFIVAHHADFADGGARLVRLVGQLSTLDCSLTWRSPREVIRRAYRRRSSGSGDEQIEMYANELLLANDSERPRTAHVRKQEREPGHVEEVRCDGRSLPWTSDSHGLAFRADVPPRGEALLSVSYSERSTARKPKRSLQYELSVTARRVLSEIRDEYVLPLRSRVAS